MSEKTPEICRHIRTSDSTAVALLLAVCFAFWPGVPGHGQEARHAGGGLARIVCLTAALTETLFALGVGDRIVGVSDDCRVGEACSGLPRVGTFLAPVVERVLALEPDLVITSPSPGNRNAVQAIERAGVRTVVVSEGSRSLDEVRASIRQTAMFVGRQSEGERLIAALNAALLAVEQRVANRTRRRTAVLVGVEPFVLAGRDSYLGELVRIAGGDNVADEVGGQWPRIGLEFLLGARPEILVDLSGAHGRASSRLVDGNLEDLPAVRAGRVFVGSASMLRPGPGLAHAVVELARDIHPEAWEAVP